VTLDPRGRRLAGLGLDVGAQAEPGKDQEKFARIVVDTACRSMRALTVSHPDSISSGRAGSALAGSSCSLAMRFESRCHDERFGLLRVPQVRPLAVVSL
jgi:hypothetical protein